MLSLRKKFHQQSFGFMLKSRYVKRMFTLWLKRIFLGAKEVLDAGCGRGDFAFYYFKLNPNCVISALDFDKKNILLCKDRLNEENILNLKFIQKDLHNLEEVNKYDLISSVDVLEHIKSPEIVLKNLYRALKKNGVIVIHTPKINPRRIFKKFKNWSQRDHIREGFDKNYLIELFKNSGFKNIKLKYTFGYFGALAWEIYTLLASLTLFLGL